MSITIDIFMSKKSPHHIAFAGGSTWGHVVPIASLLKYALRKNYRNVHETAAFFWFGEPDSLEEQECKRLREDDYQIHFLGIMSGKMRRQPNVMEFLHNITDAFKLFWWTLQSMRYLKKYHIDTIFCKWWYVSLPVVFAAKLLWVRIVVHESDSTPGLSTRIAAKFASKIFLGFPEVLQGGEYVGQIISHELINQRLAESPQVDKPTILVNCGSLGSASVHKALLGLLELDSELLEKFHWTVLLGKLNKNFRVHYEQYPQIMVYDFADQKLMGKLYCDADISICRGGSTTLMEQQLFGIHQIIIPIPWTHDQFLNGEFFAKTYGHTLIDQTKPFRSAALGDILLSKTKYRKQPVQIQDVVQQVTATKDRILDSLLT